MKNTTHVLAATLALGGMLTIGAARGAEDNPPEKPAEKPPVKSADPQPTKPVFQDRTESLGKWLDLTAEQKEKARPILDAEAKKMIELRSDKDMPMEDRRAKLKELREDTGAKLKAILTEEQWKKYSSRGVPMPVPAVKPPAPPAPPAK